ncbi:MAG: hypothetical protein NWF01_03525 [Candidatus Bathyarchaeota archaeon]|nr:hypothetical protein [Candidatus Bathyarchaeota archaeon]
MSYKKQLMENKRLFDKAEKLAVTSYSKGNYESAVAWAKIAAHFAFVRHPGFYFDSTLEEMLISIAKKIDGELVNPNDCLRGIKPVTKGKTRFLHVITESYSTGGHTAFVSRWIENTRQSSVHSLVVTSNDKESHSPLHTVIKKSQGQYVSLPEISSNIFKQALFLRKFAHENADIVVLVVHPFDPLPTLAFGVEGGPPVILINHADHTFWINASIVDLAVDYHFSGADLCVKRRGLSRSKILPIPLTKNDVKPFKDAARAQLGLSSKDVMLLAVGRPEKFLPYGKYDFLNVMVDVLKSHPNAKLFAVGPANQGLWAKSALQVDGRIKALGLLDRASLETLYQAADLYVGSFPCASGTAFLEAGAHSIPAVCLEIKELPHISGCDDVSFLKQFTAAKSTGEFADLLDLMINDSGAYFGKAHDLKESIEHEHCAPGWNRYLDDILHSLPSEHQIRVPRKVASGLEYYDVYVAYLDSKILLDELPYYSFNRLIYSNRENLSKQQSLWVQANVLMNALIKVNSLRSARECINNIKKFVSRA